MSGSRKKPDKLPATRPVIRLIDRDVLNRLEISSPSPAPISPPAIVENKARRTTVCARLSIPLHLPERICSVKTSSIPALIDKLRLAQKAVGIGIKFYKSSGCLIRIGLIHEKFFAG